MKRLLMFSLFCIAVPVALGGCSGDPDESNAPTKAEIDKQLEGLPAIDPKDSAPMGGGARIKGGAGNQAGAGAQTGGG
ncbi:MAG TPA: hypothetical protein VM328_11435 [Fimbriimonadaceae bacterium]|nr:hypothetical protein [Fimbriimonadaceae bacterium]